MAYDIRQLDRKKGLLKIISEKLNVSKEYVLEKDIPVKNKLLGYLGNYSYLKFRKVDQKVTTYFLKIVPEGKKERTFIEESGVFKAEIALYTLVFPKMLLMNHFTPKCILHIEESCILLTDMNSKGFQMVDKFVPLDFTHCKIVLEAMGKFHGQSIIFEQNYHQNVYEFLKKRKIDLHCPDNLMQGAIETDIDGISTIIDSIKEDCDDKLKEGWEKVKKKLKEEAKVYYRKIKLLQGKKVLCHSDLWSNNILFKFDDKRKPVQCCLVDFQLGRYASPALDILIFLHFTTTRKLRKEKFQDFLKIYYFSLNETLRNEGLDIGVILPWNDILNSIQCLKFACMTASLAYMSIDLLESDPKKKGAVNPEDVWNHLSVNTGELVLKQYKEISYYRERIYDSLLEFYELLTN